MEGSKVPKPFGSGVESISSVGGNATPMAASFLREDTTGNDFVALVSSAAPAGNDQDHDGGNDLD